MLGDEQREKQGAEAAFTSARQVEVTVLETLANIATVIELPVDHVNVGIEDQHFGVQAARGVGCLGGCGCEEREEESSKTYHRSVTLRYHMPKAMDVRRRDLIRGAALFPAALNARAAQVSRRPKIAALVTVYRKFSHGQHIVDRFLEGYGWNGDHHIPPMDLVSLYVDQTPEQDLSRDRAKRFPGMKIYPSIAETLTLGGSKLAVDGVLLVGEHGNYPRTEKRQVKYPRYEFWKQIVDVYRGSDRVAPVFNDKHLSWNWEWAREMYDTARAMKIPLMAGSSLPVTWRIPSVEFPDGAQPEEALCICYGGVDSYDFHGLESIQCMVERRAGGEKGVRWLQSYRGDAFWNAWKEGVWPRDLAEAALCRSHTLRPAREGFNNPFPTLDDMKRMVKDPVAYRYEHADGLKCTMILLHGLVEDFNFAARIKGRREIFSTQLYLPMPPARTSLANFFSPLVNNIEQMFLTGKPPYPLERTLLTTGLTATGVDSVHAGGTRIETSHLSISYPAPVQSTFWRT
jgi:hypothetical protein